jgi:hypothetical protein
MNSGREGITLFVVEFLPGIWITNTKSLTERFLKQKKIKEMIDCNKELNFFESAENYIISIKHQIKKDQHHKLQTYLLKITEVIHQTILDGDTLLIYDPLITRKAPVLIIAYLLRYGQLRPEQTIQSFLSKSKVPIKLDEDYQLALKIFYKNIDASS